MRITLVVELFVVNFDWNSVKNKSNTFKLDIF